MADLRFSEQALLGCLLRDPACSMKISVCAEDFVSSRYGMIFRSILEVMASGDTVDVVTVSERLEKATNRNWLPILIELHGGPGTPVNIEAYSESIRQESRARKALNVANELVRTYSEEGSVERAIKSLMEINQASKCTEYSMSEAIKIAVNDLDLAIQNPGKLIGISTGLVDLDEILGGYHKGDLIVIGARPAVGKTAVMLNQMIGAGVKVGCISGEQGISQAAQRMMSMAGGVPLVNMRNGKMSEDCWPKLQCGAQKLKQHPGMYFNDRPAPSMGEIENTARRWKFEYDIQAIYIDYLQRIKRDLSKPKHEAVGDNAARLKELGRELDIPVVALAQVRRDAEGKRPKMSDLSDSSEIEKESDLIILLYRENDSSQMDFIIDKNRHGATGVVSAAWDARCLRISNLAKEYYGHSR